MPVRLTSIESFVSLDPNSCAAKRLQILRHVRDAELAGKLLCRKQVASMMGMKEKFHAISGRFTELSKPEWCDGEHPFLADSDGQPPIKYDGGSHAVLELTEYGREYLESLERGSGPAKAQWGCGNRMRPGRSGQDSAAPTLFNNHSDSPWR